MMKFSSIEQMVPVTMNLQILSWHFSEREFFSVFKLSIQSRFWQNIRDDIQSEW